MNTSAIEIGQGGITQFAVLKFINEYSPSESLMNRFINRNYSLLVPRQGYSRYEYIELLENYGVINVGDNGNYQLTNKGLMELSYLKEIDQTQNFLENTGITFSL